MIQERSQIGLDQFKSVELSAKLNQLLADYHVFYMNVRGFHWNIKGEKFFELHLKFEELYNNLILKIDEIAERILTLGDTPVHAYSDYLRMSSIKEVKDSSNGNESVASLLDSLKKVLVLQREILQLATDADDEGTNALMSDYIREQEKMVWMYNAYLN